MGKHLCWSRFNNRFFYGTPPVAFMSTRKQRRVKRGTKKGEKSFQMKEENENILTSICKFWC